MYEGCETVLAPLVVMAQAALTRLRSDRFEAGRSGSRECGSAGKVLYVCGRVPKRRDEASMGGEVGIGTRTCWERAVGERRGVGSESSSSSSAESE
jgi:hypothetical protein